MLPYSSDGSSTKVAGSRSLTHRQLGGFLRRDRKLDRKT